MELEVNLINAKENSQNRIDRKTRSSLQFRYVLHSNV